MMKRLHLIIPVRAEFLFELLRRARVSHIKAQREISPANRKIGIVALGQEPGLRARVPVIEQLRPQRAYDQHLNQSDRDGFREWFHAAPPATGPTLVRATRRRRNFSSIQPPSRKSNPNPTSAAERPSLPITLSK